MRHAIFAASGFLLSGCATIFEGTDQWINVAVNPPEAVCEAWRGGELQDSTGPGKTRLHVSKSRNDLTITCKAAGYKPGSVVMESSVSAAGALSVVTWDFGLTDYATGALNKYDGNLSITLQPEVAAAPIVTPSKTVMQPVTD